MRRPLDHLKGDFLIDQTPARDLTQPEPLPEFDLDQSLPDPLYG